MAIPMKPRNPRRMKDENDSYVVPGVKDENDSYLKKMPAKMGMGGSVKKMPAKMGMGGGLSKMGALSKAMKKMKKM